MNRNIIIATIVVVLIAGGIWVTKNNESLYQASPTPSASDDNGRLIGAAVMVRTHAAAQYSVDEDAVTIVSADSKEWPDGCLGLAKSGEFCTEALVPGWRIEVKIANTTYIYRTDASGSVIRQEK